MAKRNVASSTVQGDVRWIVDDCLTFLDREARRVQESGIYYDGLIFDPPAFGRGKAKSQTWKFERDFQSLLDFIPKLLSKNPLFLILTCHHPDWNDQQLRDELTRVLSKSNGIESGKLALEASTSFNPKGRSLELGHYARWLNPIYR